MIDLSNQLAIQLYLESSKTLKELLIKTSLVKVPLFTIVTIQGQKYEWIGKWYPYPFKDIPF